VNQELLPGREAIDGDRVDHFEIGRDGDSIDQPMAIVKDLALEEIHRLLYVASLEGVVDRVERVFGALRTAEHLGSPTMNLRPRRKDGR